MRWNYLQLVAVDSKDRLARDELALGGMLPGKTPEEISDLLNAKVEEGMVNIRISAEAIFEENGKKGRIGIENIEANRYSFYVEYIELKQRLQAGDYKATALFTTYSLDESEDKIAETRVNLTLYVMDGIICQ